MSADGDDTASMSSSTWSQQGVDDVMVMDEDSIHSDQDLQDMVARFDAVIGLDADRDISLADTDSDASASVNKDADSLGATSSGSQGYPDEIPLSEKDGDLDGEKEEEILTANGSFIVEGDAKSKDEESEKEDKKKDVKGANGVDKSKSDKSSSEKDSQKKKNPFGFLRKLTKFDKTKKPKTSEFAQIRIDRLPQVFVVKYLGMKEVKGLFGLKYIRRPIDEMIAKVRKTLEASERIELPLVYLVVTPKGIDIREHKLNKIKDGVTYGLVPIDFISYGVQDVKFWRVFSFIVVRELSSRSKVTECHAYLCDSSLSARKVALSLGGAFRLYSKTLKAEGKPHNFQVELRPPDELAEVASKEFEA